MTTEPTEGEEQTTTRPFADVLLALSRGRTHRELSRALQQLVAAVEDTRKKGTLTLTLTVSPTKSDVLEVTDVVTVKVPTHQRAASLFYATDDHNLVREDPNQDALPGLSRVTADPSDRTQRGATA